MKGDKTAIVKIMTHPICKIAAHPILLESRPHYKQQPGFCIYATFGGEIKQYLSND